MQIEPRATAAVRMTMPMVLLHLIVSPEISRTIAAAQPAPAPAAAGDMELVRARLVASMVAPPGSSSQLAAVKAAEALARQLRPNGTFPDIDYQERRRAAWPMIAHLTRVQSMAAAWRGAGTNTSSSAQLSTLLGKALLALNVWLAHDWRNPNW